MGRKKDELLEQGTPHSNPTSLVRSLTGDPNHNRKERNLPTILDSDDTGTSNSLTVSQLPANQSLCG